MLRITKTAYGGRPALRVEGTLAGPWVDELTSACAGLTPGAPRLVLDLASVTFVDTAGTRLLRDLVGEGVEIAACSAFVAELLHWEKRHDHG